jgi:hypothetical protein
MDIQPNWDDVSDHALLVMAMDLGVETIGDSCMLSVNARSLLLKQIQLRLVEKRSNAPEAESAGPEILIHHGKYADIYYLADTPERKDAVFRRLFKQLDECGCYSSCVSLTLARTGDIRAIKVLLDSHREREYEGWESRRVIDPLKTANGLT